MEIMTTKEACSLLKLQRLTLYKMATSGEIPGFKLGKSWKFERSSLEKWIGEKLKENHKAIKE